MSNKKENKLSDRYTVRLGKFTAPLVEAANREKVKPAVIIRWSLRNYLMDSKNPDREKYEALCDSLEFFRQDFAKVGSNLHQLSRRFNFGKEVGLEEIKNSHKELQREFLNLKDHLLRLEEQLKY